MKKYSLSLILIFILLTPIYSDELDATQGEGWAAVSKRLDRAFEGTHVPDVPGRTMGLILPHDTRTDLYPLLAIGYQALADTNFKHLVYLFPVSTPGKSGLFTTSLQRLDTSIGSFDIDQQLFSELSTPEIPIAYDDELFEKEFSQSLSHHLLFLRHLFRGKWSGIKILPVFVRLSDVNSEAKDIAPAIAERLKDLAHNTDTFFIVSADMQQGLQENEVIQKDSILLTAIRALDFDSIFENNPIHLPLVGLGTLTLRFLGADHAQVLAYAQSSQLVLTKDKSTQTSYSVIAFSSDPAYPPRVPHIRKEKLEEVFNDIFRTDLLRMARQTLNSVLDPTAAKPPALNNNEAARKWPVYVSIFDADGKLLGQAGTPLPKLPLEESIRQYTFDAVKASHGRIKKDNMKSLTIELSIPHGFSKVRRPEDLIPLLNGLIVYSAHKANAFHPEEWRRYPDPHQLLSTICTKLGLSPWEYAKKISDMDSFRTLAFNEKESYQTLTPSKKKKKTSSEQGTDGTEDGTTGTGGGGDLFSF